MSTSAPAARDAVREAARRILSEARFQPPSEPHPFRRPLAWVGRQVDRVAHPVGRLFASHRGIAIVVCAMLLVAFTVWLLVLGRRRASVRQGVERLLLSTTAVDPAELEAAADRARAGGHPDLALRLRFRAGLTRLERAGRIGSSVGRTNGDVRRQLSSDEFTQLADRFDEVVYGDEPATDSDDDRARDGWRRVLSGADR